MPCCQSEVFLVLLTPAEPHYGLRAPCVGGFKRRMRDCLERKASVLFSFLPPFNMYEQTV
jgi:hypothetical protein